jgi:hypothetical protein
VLATLAVILWAYGMYALFSFIFQRQGYYGRGRSRWRRFSWLALVGSIGALVGLIVWCGFSPDKSDQRLKLAGFLGTVYAEGWTGRVDHLNYPPVQTQSREQPVYTLLHPETPAGQMEPEKKVPKPRPGRAVKKGTAGPTGPKASKVSKTPTAAKKSKKAAKIRTKKKKRSTAARTRHAHAG